MTDGPLIVQSDKTLLLEVDHELAQECRRAIAPFAELERAPEHVHTYRLTPLGLWNARAAGHDAEQVVDVAAAATAATPCRTRCSSTSPRRWTGTAGCGWRRTRCTAWCCARIDRAVLEEVLRSKKVAPLVGARLDDDTVVVHPSERGHLKQVLLKLGWPAEDLAGYVDGEAHPIAAASRTAGRCGPTSARPSRASGTAAPASSSCPAAPARRIVGAAAMAQAQATTLILVTNTVAARQWKHELLKRTTLTEDEIGEYSGAAQGDPAGHDRDVPGDDDAPEGRLRAPRAVRRARLGPHRLRRGAPAAGADLPVDRRHPVPAAARA